MNKIYFISCYFVPMGRAESSRAFMVKYFKEEGWEIEVVAGENYKSFILSFQEDPSLWNVIPQGLKIHRFNGRPGWLSYDIKKILNRPNNVRWHWIKEAEKKLDFREKGIVYAIIPPIDDAILAYRLACKFDCPLVLHYVDDVLDIEKKIVDRADLVLGVTSHIRDVLFNHYGHKNIVVVENGYLSEIEVPPKESIANPLRLVYAGSMTFRTRPEIFAQACHILQKKSPALAENVKIDFYGPENYYPFLFLQKWLNRNMRFKGFLPVAQLGETLCRYDLALASTKGEISFTSKIYQYLNAGLPVVTASDHEGLKGFVERHQIGMAASRDAVDVAEKLREIICNKERILQWRKNVLAIKPKYSLRERIRDISILLRMI